MLLTSQNVAAVVKYFNGDLFTGMNHTLKLILCSQGNHFSLIRDGYAVQISSTSSCNEMYIPR